MINQVKTYLLALQADICAQLEAVDTEATFINAHWHAKSAHKDCVDESPTTPLKP
jgi:coproporphyrinogen III oxidase